MIIDTHQHFCKYSPIRDTWIDDSMQVLKRDFMPADLWSVFQKNDVDGCVAIQADQSEVETAFLLKLADNNDFIKGVVGWVDLAKGDIEERLAYFSKYQKFKGVRHILQAERDDFVLKKDFQYGISKLQNFNLVYDILIYSNQLTNTIKLVNDFPNQIFVLDHIAKPNIREGEMAIWEKNMTLLAKSPNVYCKVSGMVTEADWEAWKPADLKPYLDVVFNSFGVDRILFGSDWPVCLLAAKYEAVLKIIKDYISPFSKAEKDKVMFQNAIKVYQLNSNYGFTT